MTDSRQRSAALHARYAQSFAVKRSALAAAWRTFVETPDETTARELHALAHRLAGSAPAYGYASLGDLARTIDAQLSAWIERPLVSREDARRLADGVAASMQALLDALGETTIAEATRTL
jgi:HPt (histidine-containing phosphotransfer) domain-containing protein